MSSIYMKVTIITSQRSSWTLCSQCSLSFGLLGNNPCTVDLKNVKQDTNCNELHKDYFFTCIFRIFETPDLFLDQCRSIVYSFGRSCAGEYNFTIF